MSSSLPLTSKSRLRIALLLLRLSVFLVMLMWTIDKFVRPTHAASVFEKYYLLGGLGNTVAFALGALEIALLTAFVLGIGKRLTYGAVLVLHGISTLASFKHYMAPFDGPNLLFFAAWPMLAACMSLYLLRDLDTLGVLPWRHSASGEILPKL